MPSPADGSLVFEISAELQGRLDFVWCGDRYAQRLEVIRGADAVLALSSHELDGDGDWPPSPPLQQLSFHQTPQGWPCALLVGMAGKSHWSLSVEQDGEGCLVFDVACRMHRRPDWLGSTYRFSHGGVDRTDGAWDLPCGGGAVRLVARTCGPDSALVRLEQPCGFAITPVAEAGPLPATIRWKYRLQLADSAGTLSSGAAI